MFNGRCLSLGTILARKIIVGIEIRTTTCARQHQSVSLTATLLRTERRASQRREGCTVWDVTVRTNAKMQTSLNSTLVIVISTQWSAWSTCHRSNALLVDPRHDCSKQFRDQEITDNKQRQRHLGKSNRQEHFGHGPFDNGICGSTSVKDAQTILSRRQPSGAPCWTQKAGHKKIVMDASHGQADGYNQVPIQKHVDGCKLELSF